MPLDIAATVVTSLLIPYLKMGADKMAEALSGETGKAVGAYTADLARKAWDHVKAAFSSEEEDQSTLQMFEKRPEAAAPLMQEVLEEKLETDPNLKTELETLLQTPGPSGQTGAQIIGEHAHLLDMRNAQVSGSRNVFAGAIYGSAAVENPRNPSPGQPVGKSDGGDSE